MMPAHCRRALPHDFDPISGWCLGGCGWRDDGQSQFGRRPRRIDVPDITAPRRAADDS